MHRAVRLLALAALTLACLAARASEDATDRSLVREKELQNFTINADGSYVELTERVILVNEERAAAGAAQQTIGYNGASSRLEVVSAHTLKADGSRLAVDAANIKDQQSDGSINAPQHLDWRVKTIIFPHVAAGDRLVFTTRLTRHTALFANQFSDLTAPGSEAVQQLTLVYDLPAAMPLTFDSRGFRASAPVAAGKRMRYRFDYEVVPLPRAEANAVSPLDERARVFVTTFASYAALARAYEAASAPAGARTPAIVQQAAAIIGGERDEFAMAIALAYWVRDNIRPLDVSLGAANHLAPNSADTVLANRYGDARDQVALLRAMLGVAGIDSSAALIDAGSAYKLPSVPSVTLQDHVITYIPSLDLYLDTTARGIAPGYLPAALLDKPVLLTASGMLGRTPSTQRDEVAINSDFVVAADGSADFIDITVFSGEGAEWWRSSNRGADPTYRANLVENILRDLGQSGRGDYDVGDTDGTADRYQIRYSGRSDNLAALPGPIGINAASGLRRSLAGLVAGYASEATREQSFVCPSYQVDEQARYLFDRAIRIIAVPMPLFLHDDMFDYSATYERQDNVVWVRRRLMFHHPGRVCSVADFKRMQPVVARMQRDLRSQLIIQAK